MRPFDALDRSPPVPPLAANAGLLAWALGTLHATFLVALAVAATYLAGGLPSVLRQTGALFGVLLFAVLWAATLWTARRALRVVLPRPGRPPPPFSDVLYEAANWGGVAGTIVLTAVTLPIGVALALDVLAGGRGTPSAAAIGAGALGVVLALSAAYAIGALVGVCFAALDRLLLALARRLT